MVASCSTKISWHSSFFETAAFSLVAAGCTTQTGSCGSLRLAIGAAQRTRALASLQKAFALWRIMRLPSSKHPGSISPPTIGTQRVGGLPREPAFSSRAFCATSVSTWLVNSATLASTRALGPNLSWRRLVTLRRVRRDAASRSCPGRSGTGPPVSPGESRGLNKERP